MIYMQILISLGARLLYPTFDSQNDGSFFSALLSKKRLTEMLWKRATLH